MNKNLNQQQHESPTVTPTSHTCKNKVHKLHRMYILCLLRDVFTGLSFLVVLIRVNSTFQVTGLVIFDEQWQQLDVTGTIENSVLRFYVLSSARGYLRTKMERWVRLKMITKTKQNDYPTVIYFNFCLDTRT